MKLLTQEEIQQKRKDFLENSHFLWFQQKRYPTKLIKQIEELRKKQGIELDKDLIIKKPLKTKWTAKDYMEVQKKILKKKGDKINRLLNY